jgi:hypothetical protein
MAGSAHRERHRLPLISVRDLLPLEPVGAQSQSARDRHVVSAIAGAAGARSRARS